MNERILELAEQAGWMMGDEVEGFNIRLEKFAQLIVQDCIRLCDQVDIVGADECIDNIKEQFGVEDSKGWICPKCGIDRTKDSCPQ